MALVDVIKYIIICNFFAIGQIYAEAKSPYSFSSMIKRYMPSQEKKIQTSEYEKEKKEIIDYVPLKINFDKNEMNKVYTRWKKYNTGTYVYICNSTTLRNLEVIIFCYEHKVVGYVQFTKIQNRKSHKIYTDFNSEKTILTRNNRFFRSAHNLDYYLIDSRFKELSIKPENLKHYDCRILDVSYSKKNNYIAAIEFKKIRNCKARPRPTDTANEWYIYSYGLLMLPKGTVYTEKVIQEILDRYKKAWECEKRLLASKKTNDEQNLTLLEKAVGKEKLECLDRYLVWDENGSK